MDLSCSENTMINFNHQQVSKLTLYYTQGQGHNHKANANRIGLKSKDWTSVESGKQHCTAMARKYQQMLYSTCVIEINAVWWWQP